MVGVKLRVYVVNVELSARGPSILVSRAAPELLEYLMKQEMRGRNRTVELKPSPVKPVSARVAVTSTSRTSAHRGLHRSPRSHRR